MSIAHFVFWLNGFCVCFKATRNCCYLGWHSCASV